jgi:hypothetical protein
MVRALRPGCFRRYLRCPARRERKGIALKPSGFQVFIQGSGKSSRSDRASPSKTAAWRQPFGALGAAAIAGGDVARMNRSSAATIAAASSGEALGAIARRGGLSAAGIATL